MKKKFIFLLLGFFLLSLVSAEQVYQVDNTINITVVCINDGYCSAAAFCNINIEAPNASLIVQGENMTNQGSFHNYTLTPVSLGKYEVGGYCQDGTTSKELNFNFIVSPNGEILSTGNGILYSLFSLILFGMICVVSFFIVALPAENEKGDDGFASKVIRLKYLRAILIFILYPLTILLLNFLNGISINFVSLSMFSGILGFLFEMMMRLSWPFTVIIIAWIVVMLIKDTNINRQLDKFDKFDPFKA